LFYEIQTSINIPSVFIDISPKKASAVSKTMPNLSARPLTLVQQIHDILLILPSFMDMRLAKTSECQPIAWRTCYLWSELRARQFLWKSRRADKSLLTSTFAQKLPKTVRF